MFKGYLLALLFLLFYGAEKGYSSALEKFVVEDIQVGKMVLDNGLEVCIFFNPEMQEAVGALSVEAGSWDDPNEFAGMAHFVEHLVFLGSQQYPKEDDFLEYIHQRGGKCNASTLKDRTTYGFSVDPVGFQGALDRFAHFFIDPIFSEELIQKEIHAVHHEFEDGRENDLIRIWKVFKETGNPYHPNKNFSCGNLLSLSKAKRVDILSWFENYYDPSKMHLVLASSFSLEEVADWVEHSFREIPIRSQKPISEKKEEITSPSQRGTFFHLSPVLNNRQLSLVWEIPREFLSKYSSHTIALLEKELGRAHPGSLAKVLESEGLSTYVKAEIWKMGHDQGIFCLHIKLTKEGTKEYAKVVERCFQAISALCHHKKKENIFSSVKIGKPKWKDLKGFQDVMEIAKDLVEGSIDDYFKEVHKSEVENSRIIESFLSHMTPRQCVYFLVAPLDFCGLALTKIEKWLGVEYCARKVTDVWLDIWEKAAPHPEVGIFAQEIQLEEDEGKDIEQGGVKEPVFIVNTTGTKIRLVEPTAPAKQLEVFFFMDTPFVGRTINNWAQSELFVRCMNLSWKETFNSEKETKCELALDMGRLCLVCSMSKEKALEGLREIFLFLREPNISMELFERARKNFLDHYEGDPDPIEHAHKILESLSMQFYSTEMQLYHTISKLTYLEHLAWQKPLFNRLSLEGAFLGSISALEAKELWNAIEGVFPFIPYKSYEVAPKASPYLEEGMAHYCAHRTHRLGNAVLFLISSRGQYAKNRVIHQIVSAFLQTEFFTELRTKQQTSYRLHSWTRVINNAVCYGFSLQSSTHHPLALLKRIEGFLECFAAEIVEKLSEEQFELLRETVSTYWKKMKNQANKQEDRFFADKNLEAVQKVSYESVLHNIQETFGVLNRKRLAILVEGRDFPPSDLEELFSMQYEPIQG